MTDKRGDTKWKYNINKKENLQSNSMKHFNFKRQCFLFYTHKIEDKYNNFMVYEAVSILVPDKAICKYKRVSGKYIKRMNSIN